MKKTAVIYGSTTGTCEDLAGKLAEVLNVSDVYNVADISEEQLQGYDVLVLGTSTWGDGELQDDWYDGLRKLKAVNMSGKLVALFGCGDSSSYEDTFCDAMGEIYQDLKDRGCTFIGNNVGTDGYTFSASKAVVDGAFVGLPLDEVNESDRTDARIAAWADEVKKSL